AQAYDGRIIVHEVSVDVTESIEGKPDYRTTIGIRCCEPCADEYLRIRSVRAEQSLSEVRGWLAAEWHWRREKRAIDALKSLDRNERFSDECVAWLAGVASGVGLNAHRARTALKSQGVGKVSTGRVVPYVPQEGLVVRAYHIGLTGEDPHGAQVQDLKALALTNGLRRQVIQAWKSGRLARLDSEGAPPESPIRRLVQGVGK